MTTITDHPPYVTRKLGPHYTPPYSVLQAAIQAAIQDGALRGAGTVGDHTLTVTVRHCAPPSMGDDGTWTDTYQGDPAGRVVVRVTDQQWVWSFYAHAPGIYTDHPDSPPVRLAARAYTG